MNNDDLIKFNPILTDALAIAEATNNILGVPRELLRELVALSVRAGVPPQVIYAVIKTGRIVTTDNMKFLSAADIAEWEQAVEEYGALADGGAAPEQEGAMQKRYVVEIKVAVRNELQLIKEVREIYDQGPGATEPVDENSDKERRVSAEAYIDDTESALMELFESSPLLQGGNVEILEISAGKDHAASEDESN